MMLWYDRRKHPLPSLHLMCTIVFATLRERLVMESEFRETTTMHGSKQIKKRLRTDYLI